MNILKLHDERMFANPATAPLYAAALAQMGYDAGGLLVTTMLAVQKQQQQQQRLSTLLQRQSAGTPPRGRRRTAKSGSTALTAMSIAKR